MAYVREQFEWRDQQRLVDLANQKSENEKFQAKITRTKGFGLENNDKIYYL
jgi:hypothetical protein